MGILTTAIPSSCTQNSKAEATTIAELQAHLEKLAIESQTQAASLKDVERRAQEAEKETLNQKLKLEEAESDRAKMEESLRKIEKEFSDYKEKYKISILTRIPGFSIPEITLDGKRYQQSEIRSINEDSVSLSHSGGILRVKSKDLPSTLKETLGIDQTTNAHTETKVLLSYITAKKAKMLNNPQIAIGDANALLEKSPISSAIGQSSQSSDESSLKAVATVSTSMANGSGFIAKHGKSIYFYTNFHVIDGASKLNAVLTGGQVLPLPDEIEIADEAEAYDLVRFRIASPKDVPALEVLGEEEEIKAGEKILALGNSGGAGVVPFLQGYIKAFGPYAIEVDAEVIRGNSGGPVIRDGTMTVLGVVTMAVQGQGDFVSQGTRFDSVRRICLRPDKIKKWRSTTLSRLVQEPNIIAQIALDNAVLNVLVRARFARKGIEGVGTDSLLSGGRSAMGAAIAAQIRSTNALLDHGKTAVAVATAKDYCERFVRSVGSIYGANVAGVGPEAYSRFNRVKFQTVADERKAICNNINQHFASELTKLWQWAPK